MTRKKQTNSIYRNIRLFKVDAFLSGLWPLNALAIIYFEQITHSYALAMLVWSITRLSQTLTEVPTGIFSDKIGRRKTLMLAALSIITCFFLWALAGQLNLADLLFVGAFFWGLSDSFLSGTQEALMYETMEELNQKESFSTLYAKTNFWMQCGLGASALLAAGITYFFSLQTLAWVSIFPISGQLITAYLFTEPKRTTTQKQLPSLTHFTLAFRRLWRNKRLRFYALFTIFDEAVGHTYRYLEAAYFKSLIKDWLINLLRFINQTSGMIGFALVPHLKRFGSVKLFFTSVTINEVIKTVGILINSIFSPFIMSCVNLFWGIAMTSKTDILQHEFSANQRATIQSIIEVFKSILGAIILYLFGILADMFTPRIAIAAGISTKLCLLLGAFLILRRKK